MKLYRSAQGPVILDKDRFYLIKDAHWDSLLPRPDLLEHLRQRLKDGRATEMPDLKEPLSPASAQEVWAAGVTYLRSRTARMEESKDAGGGSFYDRVYSADRPELFFKSPGHRVIGPAGYVRLRRDSKWNVPEPELTLLISSAGTITGYTIGNDMSSRDIEGENPLYLPQAKLYDGSCAIGPCVLVADAPLPRDTIIGLHVRRGAADVFTGQVAISQIKRELPSLVQWLCRELSFPQGCFLMTGTGIVPPDSFTLQAGDEISIAIEPIGTLTNVVAP
jgi:2-dehydro-3-deoxy-D-arabinonate dehydratase